MTERDRPHVSIVMPVRNEAAHLERAVDACLAQAYDGPIELVVALAPSEDDTAQILDAYEQRGDLTVVENPRGGAASGLNAAIAASQGDVIVRCDGHAVLPPDYVDRAVSTLEATGAGNVGGVQRAIGREPVQRAIAHAMTNPVGVGDAKFHRGGEPGPTDTVYLGVFRRSALDEVGGFDESLTRNQDYELNVRLRQAGWTVWFDPELEVEYAPRPTLTELWNQYRQYGAWKRRVLRIHPTSVRARQLGPPILVIGLTVATATLPTRLRPLGLAAIGGYGTVLDGKVRTELVT